MERSSHVKTRLRPRGWWLNPSSRLIIGLVLTSAAPGDQKRLRQSSLQTADGITQVSFQLPDHELVIAVSSPHSSGLITSTHDVLSGEIVMKALHKPHGNGKRQAR